MSLDPNSLNLIIQQNASFKLDLALTDQDNNNQPIDVSSWSVTGSIRPDYDAPPIMFFSMSLYPTGSVVRAFLTDQQTWTLSGSLYFYDIIAHNPTPAPPETYRLLSGRVAVSRGVTQP